MARNASGAERSGSSSWAVQGGTARITLSCGASDSSPSAEGQAGHLAVFELRGRSAADRGGSPRRTGRSAQGRFDECRGQARHGDARTDSPAALGERLPHHRAGKIGGSFLRRRIESGDQHGPQEFFPQQATGTAAPRRSAGRDGAASRSPRRGNRRDCVPGTRRPAARAHHGIGPSLGRSVQRGPWRRRRKGTLPGPVRQADPPRRWRADNGRRRGCRTGRGGCRCRSPCRARCLVGAAAPAGLPGGVRKHDRHAAARQRHGRRQSGQSRSDDMDARASTGCVISKHAAPHDDPQQSRLGDADAPARRRPALGEHFLQHGP